MYTIDTYGYAKKRGERPGGNVGEMFYTFVLRRKHEPWLPVF